jgi:CTP-dependent riboflavin kinase
VRNVIVKGRVVNGLNHFEGRVSKHREAFEKTVGHALVAGTINVEIAGAIRVKEDLRLKGEEIGAREDYVFERCRINGYDAYRIRPMDQNGNGGHGDHILEISCAEWVPDVGIGADVEVELFRS